MYRLDIVYLHKFVATQLMYGSVTLARCAALPFSKTLTTTNRDFLSILTVDFPSLLCSSVNLTFGSTHMARLRCLALSPLRLPYLLPHCGFPFSASQFGKSYVRKKVMCGPHASHRSNYFSVALLASSLWISLLCFAVR